MTDLELFRSYAVNGANEAFPTARGTLKAMLYSKPNTTTTLVLGFLAVCFGALFPANGADADTSAFQEAIFKADIETVKSMLKGNPALALQKDQAFNPSFLYAASLFSNNMAELFISYGADVHQTNSDGGTFLQNAAANRASAGVKALLEHGADPNAANKLGMTPLHFLASPAQRGRPSREAAELLLAAGARVNVTNSFEGMSPLHMAAAGGDADLVQLLLEHRADCCPANLRGLTPLSLAMQTRHTNVVEVFRQHGVAINQVEFAVTPEDVESESVGVKTRPSLVLVFTLKPQKLTALQTLSKSNVGGQLRVRIDGQILSEVLIGGEITSPNMQLPCRSKSEAKSAQVYLTGIGGL